nr:MULTISPECIES: MFS transporter [unclassified Rhizobium]
MVRKDSFRGIAALYVGHAAGTIDLAALPLWLGALMALYHLAPEQAGMTVSLFLAGIVVASAILAPRFHQLPQRWIAVGGFGASAICFIYASRLSVAPDSLNALLFIHAIAGLCTGSGLSMVHGSMGRTSNPHRHFGLANAVIGFLVIFMFAVMPGQIAQHGGQTVFVGFASVMAVAAVAALFFFPQSVAQTEPLVGIQKADRAPTPKIVFLIMGSVMCLMLNQSMVFAFAERVGAMRSFDAGQVQMVFVVLGFVNLLPGLLSALLQKRLPAIAVVMIGPFLQAIVALVMKNSPAFLPFGAAVLLFPAVTIFTHTFFFGLLSQIDPSGRSVAATPAMMMTGSAIGPALGGSIVATIGFGAIGWAALGVSTVSIILMLLVQRELSKQKQRQRTVAAV